MLKKWIDNQFRKYISDLKKELVQCKQENAMLVGKIEQLKNENTNLCTLLVERNAEIDRLEKKEIESAKQIRAWQRSYRDMIQQCEQTRIEYSNKMNTLLNTIKNFYTEGEA